MESVIVRCGETSIAKTRIEKGDFHNFFCGFATFEVAFKQFLRLECEKYRRISLKHMSIVPF